MCSSASARTLSGVGAPLSIAIALGTLGAIVYARRLPEPLVNVLAGVVGFVARTWIAEGA